MKRGAPLRRTAMKRGGRRRTGGVSPETATEVHERDRSCRAWPMGFALDAVCSGRGHVHHVILRSQGGPHTADNLILLCEAHHDLAHNSRRSEAETAAVIVRRRQ